MRKALLVVLILSAAVAWATGGACTGQKPLDGMTTGGYLKGVANASVRVCSDTLTPCTTIPLYSDAALTQSMSNPVTTDATGNYQYCAAPGSYNEQISGSAFSTVNNSPVTLAGSGDVLQAATNAFTGANTHSGTETFNGTVNGAFTLAAPNNNWTFATLNRGSSVRYRSGGALSSLKAALQDDFHEYVKIRLDGDSITWGMIVNGNSATDPRTHALTDPRDNLTDGSWANLLRGYLCRTYAGTSTITAGSAGAGSCSKTVSVAVTDSAISVKKADGTISAGATTVNAGATFGQYTDIAGSGGGSKIGIEFNFYGDSLTLIYSQLTTGPSYILYVDGVSQGTFTTSGTTTFGVTRAHSFTLGQHLIRIENQDVASQALRLEGVTWTKTIRVANDGIIGTGSNEWLSTGVLLTSSVASDDEFVILMIGTNDRGQTTVTPRTYSKTASNVTSTLNWIIGQGKKPILMAPNYVTQDESTFDFKEVDVQRTLSRVAEALNVDFIDHYQATQEITNLGVTCQADGLHPNDACHAQMFANIANAIDRAPNIPAIGTAPRYFYVCASGATMTSGLDAAPKCSFTPDQAITITRIELRVRGTVAAGCTVSPLVRIYDGTTSTDTGITNGVTTNSAVLSRNEGATVTVNVYWSGGTGCTTFPSDVLTTVQYKMQGSS